MKHVGGGLPRPKWNLRALTPEMKHVGTGLPRPKCRPPQTLLAPRALLRPTGPSEKGRVTGNTAANRRLALEAAEADTDDGTISSQLHGLKLCVTDPKVWLFVLIHIARTAARVSGTTSPP